MILNIPPSTMVDTFVNKIDNWALGGNYNQKTAVGYQRCFGLIVPRKYLEFAVFR